jgi:hypothetical protein
VETEQITTEPLGKRIRYFFRDIFGSRVLEHLENEKMQLREDFEKRLQDKDNVIASLREEKALLMSKVAMYEITLLPHASRAGAEVVAYQKPLKPAFSFVDMPVPKSRWQQVQEDHEKQLEAEAAEEKAKAATAAKE